MTLLQVDPNCLNETTTIVMKTMDQPQKHIPLPPPIITSDHSALFPDEASCLPLAKKLIEINRQLDFVPINPEKSK